MCFVPFKIMFFKHCSCNINFARRGTLVHKCRSITLKYKVQLRSNGSKRTDKTDKTDKKEQTD